MTPLNIFSQELQNWLRNRYPSGVFVSLISRGKLMPEVRSSGVNYNYNLVDREFPAAVHFLDTDALEQSITPSNMGPKATIYSLPNELLEMIIGDAGLNEEDRFCLKVAIPLFLPIKPTFETLHELFSPAQKYELACRLARPGSYLCSLCRTRHSYNHFTEEERGRDNLSRHCIGWGALFLVPGIFLPYASLAHNVATAHHVIQRCILQAGRVQGATDFKIVFNQSIRDGMGTCEDPSMSMVMTEQLYQGTIFINRVADHPSPPSKVDTKHYNNCLRVTFEATNEGYLIQRTDIDMVTPWLRRVLLQHNSTVLATYLLGWALPLCKHVNLKDKAVAEEILEAASGLYPEICMKKWRCEICGTRFGVTVDVERSGEGVSRLWLGSRKSLGRLLSPLDKRWTRHVLCEAPMKGEVGGKWLKV